MQIERVGIVIIDEVGLIGTHLCDGANVQGARVVGVNRWVLIRVVVAGVIEALNVAGCVVVQDV